MPGQPLVVGELEPLLTLIVDVGEAEQLAGDLPRRVVAAVLAREINAGNAERLDPRRLRRLALARDVEEVAVEIARDAPQQLLAVDAERRRQPRDLTARARDLLRVDPDRVDRRADGERLAVAIGDGAAMRRDVDHAREARIALLRQECVLDELQVDRAAEQRRRGEREQPHQEVRPPAERARRRMPCVARLHGWTITMSFGAGIAHVQLLARDALDEGVRGPGTLLELQLPPLDVQVVALRAQLLELRRTAAARGTCSRPRPPRTAAPRPKEPRPQAPVSWQRQPHATLSATRSSALRARGLRATSSLPGRSLRPISLRRGVQLRRHDRQRRERRIELRLALHEALDQAILERMEADDREASAERERIDGARRAPSRAARAHR